MKNVKFLLTFLMGSFLLSASPIFAQLTVDNTQPIEQVIQSLVGEGIVISNIQKQCPDGAWGSFDCVDCNLGMPKGLMLTSGKSTNVIGPNNSGAISEPLNTAGDPDLDAIIPSYLTNDACGVVFNLQAISDTILFRYVFGSEEYLEWVGSSFNDVFGFFISGPNPAGGNYTAENIALIPDTSIPVSINNINDVSNSAYYVDNGDGFSSPQNSDDFYIQYDGFTTVLIAKTAVVPCETYTLKLVVADAGDAALDSGVFIEAGSLTTNKIELSASTSLADLGYESAVEGCIDAIISFTPSGQVIDTTVVYFSITGTAQNGIDYTAANGQAIQDSVILYPGDTLIQLILQPVADDLMEGEETVNIQITNTSFCTTIVDTVEIKIQDNIEAQANPDNLGICLGDTVQLAGSVGITSQWSPPDFLNNPNIFNPTSIPTHSIEYMYIVSVGVCSDTAYVNIIMDDNFNPQAPTEYNVCPGQEVTLTSSGGTFTQWSPFTNLSCEFCENTIFSGTESATYTATLYDAVGCQTAFTVNVNVGTGDLGVRDTTINICPNTPTEIVVGSSGPTYTFSPTTGLSCTDCNAPTFTLSESTTYNVTATSGSCEQSGVLTVVVNPLNADAGADVLGCETLEATLGTAATEGNTYEWLPATNLNDDAIAQPIISIDTTIAFSQNYTVVVTTADGCTATDVVNVSIVTPPVLSIAQPDTLIEGNSLTLTVTGAAANDTYQWTPAASLATPAAASTLASPSQTTTYKVVVTTADGCESSTTVTVNVIEPPKLTIPTAFTPNGDDVNDVFRMVGRDITEIQTFVVFNRWGQEVYANAGNQLDGWDGTFKGQEQPSGVYAYYIEYKQKGSDEVQLKKGNVTLLR
jgi:gliding motility-associated-like protein